MNNVSIHQTQTLAAISVLWPGFVTGAFRHGPQYLQK